MEADVNTPSKHLPLLPPLTQLPIVALSAHPGYSSTDLQLRVPGMGPVYKYLLNPLFSQSAANGSLPTVRAAVDESMGADAFVGPQLGNMWYGAGEGRANAAAHNAETAAKLWAWTAEKSGFTYDW